MEQQVPLQGVTPAGAVFQPRAHQPSGQVLVAAASRPAGRNAHRLPPVARHLRLRYEHALLGVGIEPSLEAPVGLADIMQPAGMLHHVSQGGWQADAAGDSPCPRRHRLPVPFELDGVSTERRFVEVAAEQVWSRHLGSQAGHFPAGLHNLRTQRAREGGPLLGVPTGWSRRGLDRSQDLLRRFSPRRRSRSSSSLPIPRAVWMRPAAAHRTGAGSPSLRAAVHAQ